MVHGNGTVTTPPPSNNYNGSNNSKKKIKKKKRTKGKGGMADYGASGRAFTLGTQMRKVVTL